MLYFIILYGLNMLTVTGYGCYSCDEAADPLCVRDSAAAATQKIDCADAVGKCFIKESSALGKDTKDKPEEVAIP